MIFKIMKASLEPFFTKKERQKRRLTVCLSGKKRFLQKNTCTTTKKAGCQGSGKQKTPNRTASRMTATITN